MDELAIRRKLDDEIEGIRELQRLAGKGNDPEGVVLHGVAASALEQFRTSLIETPDA